MRDLANNPQYQRVRRVILANVPPVPAGVEAKQSYHPHQAGIDEFAHADRKWRFRAGKLVSYFQFRPQAEQNRGAHPLVEMYADPHA